MAIQNVLNTTGVQRYNGKVKLDLSSPERTFDTQLQAIKRRDVKILQGTLDPDSSNKDLQALRTDVQEAKQWITFKKQHLNEIRLGSEVNAIHLGSEVSEPDDVKIYKLIDPSASTSGLVFHKHDNRWLLFDTLKH